MKDLKLEALHGKRIGRADSKSGLNPEERVRLNLAQIILQGKDIIFLDEPTKGLDLICKCDFIEATYVSDVELH